jgi:hypothetical protein
VSALDAEHARRGLVRRRRAERQLHATGEVLSKSLVPVEFEWKGVTVQGFRATDLAKLHDRMWPKCPWAVKGLCEIEQARKVEP